MYHRNDLLPNGAKVICRRTNFRTGAEFVLAEALNTKHEAVTWQITDEGNTVLGHYFTNFEAAKIDFLERA